MNPASASSSSTSNSTSTPLRVSASFGALTATAIGAVIRIIDTSSASSSSKTQTKEANYGGVVCDYELKTFSSHGDSVMSVIFPTKDILASGSCYTPSLQNPTIQLFSTIDGKSLINEEYSESTTGQQQQPLCCYCLASDGNILVSGNNSGSCHFWNCCKNNSKNAGAATPLFDGEALATGHRHVLTVALSPPTSSIPQSYFLATGGGDSKIKLWYTSTQTRVGSNKLFEDLHDNYVVGVTFGVSANGSLLLATASSDKTARIIRIYSKANSLIHNSSNNSSTQQQQTSSNNNNSQIVNLDFQYECEILPPLKKHTAGVSCVAFSQQNNCKFLATGSIDGDMILFDVNSLQQVGTTISLHSLPVMSVVFAGGGNGSNNNNNTNKNNNNNLFHNKIPLLLISASKDGSVAFYDCDNFVPFAKSLQPHVDGIFSIAVSTLHNEAPHQLSLATASDDATVKLFHLDFFNSSEDHKNLQQSFDCEDQIIDMWFAKDGTAIETKLKNGNFQKFDLKINLESLLSRFPSQFLFDINTDIDFMQSLGQGASAVVYRSLLKLNSQPVAAKVFRECDNIKTVAKILQEMKLGLNLHFQNVAKTIGFGVLQSSLDQRLVIISELCDYSLQQFLTSVIGSSINSSNNNNNNNNNNKEESNVKSLSFETIFGYARQIIEGVAYLHINNIISRDIKPSNILVKVLSGSSNSSNDYRNVLLQIADFGLSVVTSQYNESTEVTTQGCCTLRYASSDAITDKKASFKHDVYSLGATLYWLFDETGQEPFHNCSIAEILSQKLLDRFVPRKDCPKELAQLIRDCLAPNPVNRISNAVEVALRFFGGAEVPRWLQEEIKKKQNKTAAAAAATNNNNNNNNNNDDFPSPTSSWDSNVATRGDTTATNMTEQFFDDDENLTNYYSSVTNTKGINF